MAVVAGLNVTFWYYSIGLPPVTPFSSNKRPFDAFLASLFHYNREGDTEHEWLQGVLVFIQHNVVASHLIFLTTCGPFLPKNVTVITVVTFRTWGWCIRKSVSDDEYHRWCATDNGYSSERKIKVVLCRKWFCIKVIGFRRSRQWYVLRRLLEKVVTNGIPQNKEEIFQNLAMEKDENLGKKLKKCDWWEKSIYLINFDFF